jgi:hypothetical protein
MFKFFSILIAITTIFKLLVSGGHQVLVLLLVDKKGTWQPLGVFVSLSSRKAPNGHWVPVFLLFVD